MPSANCFGSKPIRAFVLGVLVLLVCAIVLAPIPVHAQHEAQQRLLKPFADALTSVPARSIRSGSVYVPAYTQLPVGAGAFNVDLAVTLSIRNTSADSVLTIRKIDFFGTSGKLLETYLTMPIGLRPYGTVNLFISAMDRRGGSGGNFVVDWAGDDKSNEPLIEAIMLGEFAGRAYSFVSRGVETKPSPSAHRP